jgi:TolB-like protein
MRNLAVLMLGLLVMAGGVFAKDNLAILPFTGGVDEEGEVIAELFSFEPDLTAVFDPVPRTSINRAIRNEQRFQMAGGMTDPDTVAELGKQLGARYVVSGSITALGGQKLLVIAILQVEDLRQIAGDVQTYGNIEEIQDKLPAMARNIGEAAKRDTPSLPRLALPPVELAGGADKKDADTLAQILAVHLVRGGKYAVYPRTASLGRIQEEYANQLSGDTAEEHLVDMGRGTNPERVLSVTARKLGTRNMFNAAVINLITGVQEAGKTVNYQGLDDGIRAMEDLSVTLGGRTVPAGKEWRAADEASFKEAIAAINAAKDGEYTITLTGSFPADPVSFSNGAAKTITLRGEAAERIISCKADKPLFTVPGTVTLVLDNNLTLNGNNKKAWLGLVQMEGGALVMKAGATLMGSADIGVQVSSGGSFTMSGGTISGNSVAGGSGGVYIEDGSFTMSGGTISGNSAMGGGGGVYIEDGSFTMSGGTISGNSANGDIGGGVYVTGSFNMSGGTISGNSAMGGGGVYVSGSFSMSGGTISGNSATMGGGGVYVSGSFTMSGGTISGNSASGDIGGGGVYVEASGRFVKTGGTIDGTTTARKGKVVYVYDGSKKRNSAAGPGVNVDSGIKGKAGGWE